MKRKETKRLLSENSTLVAVIIVHIFPRLAAFIKLCLVGEREYIFCAVFRFKNLSRKIYWISRPICSTSDAFKQIAFKNTHAVRTFPLKKVKVFPSITVTF